MKRIYKIQVQGHEFTTEDWMKLKEKEAICKGMREDYMITFPDGYKLTAKFEGIMNKISITITIEELRVINQFLQVVPVAKDHLEKALNSILFKIAEKLRSRAITKINHQDNDQTRITIEYYEGFTLHNFLENINFDFEKYPYESNVLMKITEVIYQQL